MFASEFDTKLRIHRVDLIRDFITQNVSHHLSVFSCVNYYELYILLNSLTSRPINSTALLFLHLMVYTIHKLGDDGWAAGFRSYPLLQCLTFLFPAVSILTYFGLELLNKLNNLAFNGFFTVCLLHHIQLTPMSFIYINFLYIPLK